MTLSNRFSYPYCQYPYGWGDKFKHYGTRLFCGCLELFGIGWIARKKQESFLYTDLIDLQKYCQIYRAKTLKYGMILVSSSVVCSIIMNHFRTHRKEEKWFAIGIGSSMILLCLFPFIGNVYKYLQCSEQWRVTNHKLNVMRAMKAASIEMKTIEMKDVHTWNRHDINSVIFERLDNRKVSWNILSNSNPVTLEAHYVVYNLYYENLYFIFGSEILAKEFLRNIQKISATDVTRIANDPIEAERIHNEFVHSHMHALIFDHYYRQLPSTN